MPAAAAAQPQQQQSRGGGNLRQGEPAHHAAHRSVSNAHKRKGSAASSTSSSSAGGANSASMAATSAAAPAGGPTPSTSTSLAGGQNPSASGSAASSSTTTTPLSSMLGAELHLTLNTGSKDKERPVVTGQLWCYDPAYGSLVLSTRSSSASGSNYRVVRLANIQQVTVTKSPTSASSGNINLPPVDVGRLVEREAEGVRNEAKRIANEPPPGVSELGKALYEALSKTLPVRWANKSIVVMDEVLVDPPYNSTEQCIKSNNAQRKERVTKVILGETNKLQKTRPEILTQ